MNQYEITISVIELPLRSQKMKRNCVHLISVWKICNKIREILRKGAIFFGIRNISNGRLSMKNRALNGEEIHEENDNSLCENH